MPQHVYLVTINKAGFDLISSYFSSIHGCGVTMRSYGLSPTVITTLAISVTFNYCKSLYLIARVNMGIVSSFECVSDR